MISLDQVTLLEQKVESAVAKIQQLQAENDALRSKCLELTNALSSKSKQLTTIETDQNQIESGILKALDRLNSIENSVLRVAGQAALTSQSKTIQNTAQVASSKAVQDNATNSVSASQTNNNTNYIENSRNSISNKINNIENKNESSQLNTTVNNTINSSPINSSIVQFSQPVNHSFDTMEKVPQTLSVDSSESVKNTVNTDNTLIENNDPFANLTFETPNITDINRASSVFDNNTVSTNEETSDDSLIDDSQDSLGFDIF